MNPLGELVEVMATLRGPGGCPWDREQTHESLIPYMIEEAYEAIEAIEQGDTDELKKELGDVMLQVVFHAQLAKEMGKWDIGDVADSVVAKLKERHPHVFGDTTVDSSGEVLKNWEQIKQGERARDGKDSMLEGFPNHLPALRKASRVQDKVSRVGFDWDHIDDVSAKVEEELMEFRTAIASGDRDKIGDELGDVFFALVNLARYLKVDAEDSLRGTISKFIRRFQFIEHELARDGKKPQDSTLAEMDVLWERCKSEENEAT
jgi:tetrapyrrole methylase family protein / MazG family protein